MRQIIIIRLTCQSGSVSLDPAANGNLSDERQRSNELTRRVTGNDNNLGKLKKLYLDQRN